YTLAEKRLAAAEGGYSLRHVLHSYLRNATPQQRRSFFNVVSGESSTFKPNLRTLRAAADDLEASCSPRKLGDFLMTHNWSPPKLREQSARPNGRSQARNLMTHNWTALRLREPSTRPNGRPQGRNLIKGTTARR